MNNCPNCSNQYQAGDEVCRTCGFILPLSTAIISTGKILQTRYEIQELVHSGGMGYVYLATDKRLYDRLCIVKQIKEPIKSDAHRKKLEEEALRMSRLNHPNVAIILDHFIDGGYYFLVVERIYGKTLSEVFKERRGHLTENEVVDWAISICEVVSYLHKEGIVHRDISPDNIMLTNEGSIKFIDFGTLRELRYIVPGGTAGMGKYGYTPPEQWQGKPEFRSDIFALGATIYYLLTGFLPLSREYLTKQTPQKDDFNPIFPPIRTRNPSVSPQLEVVLQKALRLDINDRYSSVEEFGEALRNLKRVKGKKIPALKVEPERFDFTDIAPKAKATRPKPIVKPKTRMPLRWAVISLGIILFLMAGAGGIYFNSRNQAALSPALTIQGVSVATVTDTGAVLAWTTDKPASSQAEYGATAELGSVSALGQEPVTSHSIQLTGLQSNTTYYFKVISKDAGGKEAISDTGQLTTLPAAVQSSSSPPQSQPPAQTTAPSPVPPHPAELSFKAKTYTNTKYGFSLQYPSDWVERPELLITPYHLVGFGVAAFCPGVAILAFDADAPESNDWIIKTFRLMKATSPMKVASPIKEETLADGTKTYTYKMKYISSTGFEIDAYVMDVDRDGKRIRLDVFTIDSYFPYDEKLFSEIAHTLRFTAQ